MQTAFLYLQFVFIYFWHKKIIKKMLVKYCYNWLHGSISSTFYARILAPKFSNPKDSFVIFGTKISAQNARENMLMKSTPGFFPTNGTHLHKYSTCLYCCWGIHSFSLLYTLLQKRKKDIYWIYFTTLSNLAVPKIFNTLTQAWATSGPRATCSQPSILMCPQTFF